MKTIGFIGAGRIARIMIEGWSRAGGLPHDVVVHDIDKAKAEGLAADFDGVRVSDLAAAAAQEVVVVGVHPPALARHLREDAIMLSLMPKLRFAKLSDLLGGFTRMARQNPNAPSIVDHGYNPIAFADGLDAAGRQVLLDLLRPLGECPEVAEETIEAYALISAMGPTYLWFQLDLLRSLGIDFGLSDTAARNAVAKMAHGAVSTLLESDLPPEQVLDLVPVKPLAGDEAAIAAIYRSRLEPLYAKLTS